MTIGLLILLCAVSANAAGLSNAPARGELMELFVKVCDEAGYEFPLTTLPITRLEIARHLDAMRELPMMRSRLRTDAGFRARYQLLRRWLRDELAYLASGEDNGAVEAAAKLHRLYLEGRYLTQAGPTFDPWPRNDPRVWEMALGFSADATVERHFSLTVEPQFTYRTRPKARPPLENDDWIPAGELRRGYVMGAVGNVAVEIGRDDFWWGPGRFGNFLLTDNAGPLDHVRLGSRESFALPRVHPLFGTWRIQGLVAKLEDDREFPNALLFGGRLTGQFLNVLELGVSRAIQAGGEGRSDLDLSDVGDIIVGRSEHEYADSDTNQLAQFDARLSLGSLRGLWDRWLPLREVELWGEMGADSVHNYFPSNQALLWGGLLDFGVIDVTYEFANTQAQSPWYEHYIYTDGYTFHDEIIGHEIGCCTRRHTGRVRLWTPWPARLEVRGDSADKRWRQIETEMTGVEGALIVLGDCFSLRASGGVWLLEQNNHIAGLPDESGAVSWGELSLAWRP